MNLIFFKSIYAWAPNKKDLVSYAFVVKGRLTTYIPMHLQKKKKEEKYQIRPLWETTDKNPM